MAKELKIEHLDDANAIVRKANHLLDKAVQYGLSKGMHWYPIEVALAKNVIMAAVYDDDMAGVSANLDESKTNVARKQIARAIAYHEGSESLSLPCMGEQWLAAEKEAAEKWAAGERKREQFRKTRGKPRPNVAPSADRQSSEDTASEPESAEKEPEIGFVGLAPTS